MISWAPQGSTYDSLPHDPHKSPHTRPGPGDISTDSWAPHGSTYTAPDNPPLTSTAHTSMDHRAQYVIEPSEHEDWSPIPDVHRESSGSSNTPSLHGTFGLGTRQSSLGQGYDSMVSEERWSRTNAAQEYDRSTVYELYETDPDTSRPVSSLYPPSPPSARTIAEPTHSGAASHLRRPSQSAPPDKAHAHEFEERARHLTPLFIPPAKSSLHSSMQTRPQMPPPPPPSSHGHDLPRKGSVHHVGAAATHSVEKRRVEDLYQRPFQPSTSQEVGTKLQSTARRGSVDHGTKPGLSDSVNGKGKVKENDREEQYPSSSKKKDNRTKRQEPLKPEPRPFSVEDVDVTTLSLLSVATRC